MKILITGGAGFIGSNLAIRLKEKLTKARIFCLDNYSRRGSKLNADRLRKSGIVTVRGDVRKKNDLRSLRGADIIVDCAADPCVLSGIENGADYVLETNLLGTLNCLSSAQAWGSDFIFISTSRVYPTQPLNDVPLVETKTRFEAKTGCRRAGFSRNGISEDFPLEGSRSFYGASKLAAEHILNEYMAYGRIRGVINRCSVIAGPWQMAKGDQGVLTFWVAKHLLRQPLAYIGYGGMGKQVRDFLHVDDLCDLLVAQIKDIAKFRNGTYNVGGGPKNSASLCELTTLCQEVTGVKTPIGCVRQTRKADVKYFVSDHARISALCGWHPRKSVRDIVSDAAAWITSNKNQVEPVLT